MFKPFRVAVPATTANLGPGFDCLGLALTLYNRVVVEPSDALTLKISGHGVGLLPEDEKNLVWRAARHLWQRVNYPMPTLSLSMHNGIPLSSGLGSSSAAIVAGLLLANQVAGEPCTRQELLEMAAELDGHADNVAPAFLGGLVVAALARRQVLTASFPWPQDLRLVVCVPDFTLLTEETRRALPTNVPHADAVFNVARVALLLAALENADFTLLKEAARDRLHQAYRLALIPGSDVVRKQALAEGALATVVSGGGPTLLSLVAPDADVDAVGSAMRSGFATAGVNAQYLVLAPDLGGAVVTEV